jgi:competence protein ComGC
VVGVGGWGWFPLAFEHSKVCTLCDFGHLQFIISIILLLFLPSTYPFKNVLKQTKNILMEKNIF